MMAEKDPLVSVKVSVRQWKMTRNDEIRPQAKSHVPQQISTESTVISRPSFRLHTAWFIGGTSHWRPPYGSLLDARILACCAAIPPGLVASCDQPLATVGESRGGQTGGLAT